VPPYEGTQRNAGAQFVEKAGRKGHLVIQDRRPLAGRLVS
jgi:hypothetical protein